MTARAFVATIAAVFALTVPSAVAQAQSSPPDSGHRPVLTAADLDVFLDGLVPQELVRSQVAGAVVAVVKDGQLLLAKGYGFADVANRVPVSADRTLFRVASISKLFNATAVMQLVEQGKLALDQDIGDYLDFEIPRRLPGKITLRHLLTHTAGFEESVKDLPSDSGKSVPLREVVKVPPIQIYEPGTVTAYSNYGADLAGYIVERASGIPFAEYIRVNILVPLGMQHSSIASPLPADLQPLVSKEYDVASGPAQDFEVLDGEPSGNMSATAADIARFAIAHLQLGRWEDRRILREETARLMATTQFRTHPEVNGMGLGFFEESRNGYRIVGHGGDLTRFHSHLSLLMDEGVGFFISVNSNGSGGFYGVREAVRDRFLDRYFPRTTALEPVLPDAAAEAQKVAGPYTFSRRGEHTLAKFIGLVMPLDIAANDDGSIQIQILTGPDGRPTRWYPFAPLLFRTADGSERVGFVTGPDGSITRMAWVGGHELHRVGLADSRRANLWIAGSAVAVFVATLLLWPVAGLTRRRYRQPVPADGVSGRLRGATRIVAGLNLAALASFLVFFYLGMTRKIATDSRTDPLLAGIRLLGLVGGVGGVLLVVAAIRSWRTGTNGWARAKYTAMVLASVALTWFLVHWNLLSVNFDY